MMANHNHHSLQRSKQQVFKIAFSNTRYSGLLSNLSYFAYLEILFSRVFRIKVSRVTFTAKWYFDLRKISNHIIQL